MTNIEGQPERRNVLVTSLIVIVFFLADGNFDDGVKIALVGIGFGNQNTLIIFFWVMFLWFGLRYWQVNKDTANHELSQELNSPKISKIHKYIVCNIGGISEQQYKQGSYTLNLQAHTSDWYIRRPGDSSNRSLTNWEIVKTKLLMYAYYSVYGNSINKHIMPYILFYLALLIGINHFFTVSIIGLFMVALFITIEFLFYIRE